MKTQKSTKKPERKMKLRELKVQIRVVVEPDDGGFHAYCPDLKGLHACGDTHEEVRQNVDEAIQLYFESLIKHEHPIPVGVLQSDVVHPSIWRYALNRLKEKLSPAPRQQSFIEEITIPYAPA